MSVISLSSVRFNRDINKGFEECQATLRRLSKLKACDEAAKALLFAISEVERLIPCPRTKYLRLSDYKNSINIEDGNATHTVQEFVFACNYADYLVDSKEELDAIPDNNFLSVSVCQLVNLQDEWNDNYLKATDQAINYHFNEWVLKQVGSGDAKVAAVIHIANFLIRDLMFGRGWNLTGIIGDGETFMVSLVKEDQLIGISTSYKGFHVCEDVLEKVSAKLKSGE